MENFKVLLRCLAAGDKTILQSEDGNYVAIQCRDMRGMSKNCEEKDIESRLMYELYGEYPLSEANEIDYFYKTRPAFFMPDLKMPEKRFI